MNSNRPSGTVTFLFTDIEDSTKLWEQYPEAMKMALAKHDSILKEAIVSNHGYVVKTTGDGVHAVFTTALEGINAAIGAQHTIQTSEFFKNSEVSLRVCFKGELAFILSIRGQIFYFARQNLAQAKADLEEAARLAKEEGYRWASSFLAIGMAHTAAFMGDIESARVAFQESGEIAIKLGNKRVLYSSRSELAHVLRAQGELDEPLGIYRDLLPRWKDLGHRAAVAHELECIAYILTRKEEPERATILLSAAQEIRRVIGTPRTNVEEVEYEKEVATLREMLGEDDAERKWNEGRGLTMDEAIELVLKENA